MGVPRLSGHSYYKNTNWLGGENFFKSNSHLVLFLVVLGSPLTQMVQKLFLLVGAIQALRNTFWKFDTHPPPRNANNVEPYIFVTLFWEI